MALIVQKYGGSSVGTLDRIRFIADKVAATKEAGHQVVVIVSAMYGETDRLLQLANALTPHHDPRELDVLLSTGEQVSTALLSMALNAKQFSAKSYTASQVGVITDNNHTKARILEVKTQLIRETLEKNHIVIITGFQGVTEQGDITTLGRGGSDTSAVAIAGALRASECQIYTDVDGVYTTDPHVLPEAQLLPEVSFEAMLEMASLGAKVLQLRSVELACLYEMPIRILSSFTEGRGTLVTFEDQLMQKRSITGIAFSRNEALITVQYNSASHTLPLELLQLLAESQIEIDLYTQSQSSDQHAEIAFSLPRKEVPKAVKLIENLQSISNEPFTISQNTKLAKLSVIGTGIRSNANIISKVAKTLHDAHIHSFLLQSSEIRISTMINEAQLDLAVNKVHQALDLNKPVDILPSLIAG